MMLAAMSAHPPSPIVHVAHKHIQGHRMLVLITILAAGVLVPVRVLTEDILGCGGFIKSDIDINFSQVVVKLYTKQGSLKDHTDCAPNNGYYFLPLYDKGEYVLKIDPPAGWSFEPKEVKLNVDGVSDQCSKGIDINFVFKGFAVIGKVVSAGSDDGPKGVTVSLVPESQPEGPSLHTMLTAARGRFQFTPVLPGRYMVRASHPRWMLADNSVVVALAGSNAEVPPGSLVVAGYDVAGTVTSDDEPIKGVSFVLFQDDNADLPTDIMGCDSSPLSGFKAGDTPLCHVNSDDRGKFLFPSLPPGRYRVMPHYEGPQSIKFDVKPVEVAFTVSNDSLLMDTQFQVKGFSVSGKILLRPGGRGVPGATIFLNGIENSHTKDDGTYHLENMQAGSYTLQVVANDIKFMEVQVKITPNTPQLADIYPSAFKVCGRVTPHRVALGKTDTSSRQVVISPIGSGQHQSTVLNTHTESGEFCLFLEPGNYDISVTVNEDERNNGLIFTPSVHTVHVTDSPIKTDIVFSQLKVKLTGEIQCQPSQENCGDIPVFLNAIRSDNPEARTPAGTVVSHGGRYMFVDILPGTYQVSVDKDDWCWESTSHVLSVSSPDWSVPPFKQTGFSITILSSHDTKVECKYQAAKEPFYPVMDLFVKQGTTKSCVSSPGVYEFVPIGCHGYSQPSVKYNLSATPVHPIRLTALSHTVGGRVISEERVDNMYVNVMTEDDKLKMRLGPLKAEPVQAGKFSYRFALLVAEGEKLNFVPLAGTLLFSPPTMKVVGPNDCTESAVEFLAEKGHLMEGTVLPPLTGVKVTVSRVGGTEVIASADTAADGKFKFGPLPGGTEYRIAATKDGYVLTGPDAHGNFNAHKLAEVIVEVLDKADNKPLQGVLLSLSGGESFRRNSQTGANGKRTFSSLSPSEYYLRPMMKEYRFEPSSKMITVKEGATVNIQLYGHQVAFSAYGVVTSLSGDAEEAVVVEAVGMDECSQYQEESTTEGNGQFRIRGLQPQCEYTIRVKKGASINQHIERSTPDGISVKAVEGNITGLKLIVFHPVTQMDLSAHVQTSSPDHLRTLRAKLCREDAPDSPVHIIKLDTFGSTKTSKGSSSAMILFPSIPVDGRGYFIQLESSLSRTTHTYTTHAVHFRANSSFKHIKLTFKPDPKIIEQELGHSSYMILPLIVVGLLVYFNWQKIIPLLNRVAQTLNSSATSASSTRPSPPSPDVSDAVMVEPVMNVRSRKIKPRKT